MEEETWATTLGTQFHLANTNEPFVLASGRKKLQPDTAVTIMVGISTETSHHDTDILHKSQI